MLDRAVRACYAGAGISDDPATHGRPAPLLSDLARRARRRGRCGASLAERLQPYATGSHSSLFARPSSAQPDGQLVCFSLRGLPDRLKAPALLLCLDAIWRSLEGPLRKRCVLVDEAWLLMREPAGREVPLPAREERAQALVRTDHRHPGRRRPALLRARPVGRSPTPPRRCCCGRRRRRSSGSARRSTSPRGERRYLLSCPTGQRPAARERARRGTRAAARSSPARAEHRLVTSDPAELAELELEDAALIKAALIGASALLLLPALAIAAATGGINLSTPSQTAVADIPPDYLLLYQQAGLAFDVPWQVLAGIGKVECDHGRNPDPACWQEGVENAAGAGGPMQFLAATWQSYGIDAERRAARRPLEPGRRDRLRRQLPESKRRPRRHRGGALRLQPLRQPTCSRCSPGPSLYAKRLRRRREPPTQRRPRARPSRPSRGRAGRGRLRARPARHPVPLGRRRAGRLRLLRPRAGRLRAPPASRCRGSRRPSTTPARPSRPAQPLQPGDLVFFGADPADVDACRDRRQPGRDGRRAAQRCRRPHRALQLARLPRRHPTSGSATVTSTHAIAARALPARPVARARAHAPRARAHALDARSSVRRSRLCALVAVALAVRFAARAVARAAARARRAAAAARGSARARSRGCAAAVVGAARSAAAAARASARRAAAACLGDRRRPRRQPVPALDPRRGPARPGRARARLRLARHHHHPLEQPADEDSDAMRTDGEDA